MQCSNLVNRYHLISCMARLKRWKPSEFSIHPVWMAKSPLTTSAHAIDKRRIGLDGNQPKIVPIRQEYYGQGKEALRPCFYLIGSGISAMGDTNLPKWDDFVKGLMAGLGRCAGLRKEDVVLLEKLDQHRRTIKEQIRQVPKVRTRHARPSYLENYHMTDVLSRRLGEGYLKVLEVFQGARSNDLHKEMLDDIIKLPASKALGIVTTNFDTCLDQDLEQRQKEGEINLCKMKGDLGEDLNTLESVVSEKGYKNRPTILLCQSFKSFDLVSSLMYHILDPDSPFRFVFNIHGTATDSSTCVDSNFQREQRLPYGVAQALRSLYIKCRFIVAGYSGLDMNENLDYLLMLSCSEHIESLWLDIDDNPKDGICNNLREALPRRAKEKDAMSKKSVDDSSRTRGTVPLPLQRVGVEKDSITLCSADLKLLKRHFIWVDKEEEGGDLIGNNYEDQLNISLAAACSFEPIWAVLALIDTVRALSNELNRQVMRKEVEYREKLIKGEEVSQSEVVDRGETIMGEGEKKTVKVEFVFEKDESEVGRGIWKPKSIPIQKRISKDAKIELAIQNKKLKIIKDDLEELHSSLDSRLEALTRRAGQSDPCTSKAELRKAWREGWLNKNVHCPEDRIDHDKQIVSLVELFHRVRRGLEPLSNQLKLLDDLAESIETRPDMPDGWVVWATYVMLNCHDEKSRTLCWAYYIKAVRSALHSGNVWAKLALDDFKDGVWKELGWEDFEKKENENTTAIRFHRKIPETNQETLDEFHRRMDEKTAGFNLQPSQYLKIDKLVGLMHVLSIDPDLPVHHHAEIPLGEYYRVVLIIALLFSKKAVIRKSEPRGNRVFVSETLHEAEGRLRLFPRTTDVGVLKRMKANDTLSKEEKTFKNIAETNLDQERKPVPVQSCLYWVREDDKADLQHFSSDNDEMVSKVVSRNGEFNSNQECKTDNTKALRTAMKSLLKCEKMEDVLVDFITGAYGDRNENKHNESVKIKNRGDQLERSNDLENKNKIGKPEDTKYRPAVQAVVRKLNLFIENYENCSISSRPIWSRDLLYDIFNLTSEQILPPSDSRRNALLGNGLGDWIQNVYKKKPWRYQDIFQLLISAPFAVHLAITKRHSVLVFNAYETCLYLLGVLAHTTEEERAGLHIKMHRLDGEWSDYQRFSLYDVANLREEQSIVERISSHHDAQENDLVGEEQVMKKLQEKQLFAKFSPRYAKEEDIEAEQRKIMSFKPSSHADSNSILKHHPPGTDVKYWLEKRRRTVDRLWDEFIICAGKPLGSVYNAPKFNPSIYQLAQNSNDEIR